MIAAVWGILISFIYSWMLLNLFQRQCKILIIGCEYSLSFFSDVVQLQYFKLSRAVIYDKYALHNHP